MLEWNCIQKVTFWFQLFFLVIKISQFFDTKNIKYMFILHDVVKMFYDFSNILLQWFVLLSIQGLKGRGRKSPKKKNKEINTSVKERRDSDNSSRSANESMPTEKPEKKRGKDLEKKKQAAEQSEDMTVCR